MGRIFKTIFLLLSWQSALSQSFLFNQFQVENEIGGTQYNTIYFDHDGMMWVGTSIGLYQYDGETFNLYSINKNNFENDVKAIFEDNNKTLWVGYKNGNIALLKNDQLAIYNPEEGLPVKSITSIVQDKKGMMWITTAGEGIYFLKDKRWYNINEDDGLNDNYTYKAIATVDGNVWVGTDQGIAVCSADVKNKIIRKIEYQDGLPDEIIRDLYKDKEGNIWIGTQDKGVCKYVSKNNRVEIPSAMKNWKYGQINSLIISNNEWWTGTEGQGLVNFNFINESMRSFDKNENTTFNNISCIAKDREGNIWAASNNGLIKTPGNSLTFINSIEEKKLSFIHTIISASNNRVFFSPDQQLTSITFKNDDEITRDYAITSPEKLIDIISLYEDKCGYIWIGTMGDGLYRLNPSTGSKQKLNGPVSLSKASVLSIDATETEIWIATLGGVIKCKIPVDCNTDFIQPEFLSLETQKEIGNYFVYKVFVDSKNRVWFGTDGKGIIYFDGTTYKNYDKTNGLKSDVIYSITEDKQGNIWFSTLDNGIYKFDGKYFKYFTTENGLSENNASSIIYDGNRYIVIVNQRGIDLLDTETGNIEYVRPENNLEKNESDLNSIFLDKYGTVWIGTEKGIIKFNSQFKPDNSSAMPVLKKVTLLSDHSGLSNNTVLKYNQNNISFDFAGLWYADPARVNYQYILEGYNKQWITTKDKRVIFPDLPPGNYKFKLKASAINNFINAKETSFDFKISKPIWEEIWFRIGSVLLITIGVLYYLKIRENNIKRLQLLEREKIKFQLDTLKSQVNPHFLFNSFNTLISIIESDKDIAIEYVENLSDFFRNIVYYRDKDFITVQEELKLSASYFFLQQKRFGSNLVMNTCIAKNKNEMLLPPLVVQILIENAVKHNAVSKETPLTINITTEENRLVVKNNINIKRSVEVSTNSGLQNIINRYRLLTREEIEITKTDHEFIVSIPLIEKTT